MNITGRNLKVSSRKLVELSKQGDVEAFTQLIKRYEQKIYALTHHICSSVKADIDDIFQDTFIKAFEKIQQFRGDADFGTWLYRIALNECWQRLRKKERTPVVPLLDNPGRSSGHNGAFPEPIDWQAVPDKLSERKELKDIMDQALNELPETYRIVLLLRDIQGLSSEEAARATGESVAAIKSRLHRGRLFLRDKLERYFSGRKKHPWIAKTS